MIQGLVSVILISIPLVTLGIVTYLYFLERKRSQKIMEKLEKVNFKPIEKKISKLVEEENKYFKKIFELEMLLESYRKATWIIGEKTDELEQKFKDVENLPKDYERTYRDVVRKILEMDNKFTDKFNMLGEAFLKMKDEKK